MNATLGHCTARAAGTVRLVACDLDGTLLRSDGTLSSRTLAAIRAIEERGIQFVIATARAPRMLLPLVALHDVDGMAICGNGSLLVELATGRLVRTFPLAADLAMDLVRRMRQRLPGCAFAVEVIDRFGHEIAYVPMHEVPSDALIEDALTLASRGPTKLLIQHRDLTIIELFERVTAICGTLATAHYSSDSFVEITAPGIDKASALAQLCEDLGIHRNAVVAVGDMPIDLPMLAWAGRGVAVANAHPDVLAAVSETVASNDEDGVADLLRSLLIS
jgi:Cof subfamily protein (haloacid dehalogenase superfamily)